MSLIKADKLKRLQGFVCVCVYIYTQAGTLERGFGARGFSTGALDEAVCFLLDAVMVSRTLVALVCDDGDADGFPDPLTCSFTNTSCNRV